MKEDRDFVATKGVARKMRELALKSGLAEILARDKAAEEKHKREEKERIKKWRAKEYEDTIAKIKEASEKRITDIVVSQLSSELVSRLKAEGFHVHGYHYDTETRIWW